MTLYEYLALSNDEQWEEFWEHCVHLDNYKSIDCKFSLYSLHKFFIELELCITTDKILGKYPFKQGGRMEKYIGNLNTEI